MEAMAVNICLAVFLSIYRWDTLHVAVCTRSWHLYHDDSQNICLFVYDSFATANMFLEKLHFFNQHDEETFWYSRFCNTISFIGVILKPQNIINWINEKMQTSKIAGPQSEHSLFACIPQMVHIKGVIICFFFTYPVPLGSLWFNS